ncbi:GntR family transcriptional regulator [Shinella oryzae]|uniref:GntR family transcriptional regulator n=1 Tax=Shinella oryzae TaxID=2871820 RepID=A0ABY9K9U8_9HYPH|nr:GntR family transcriptional regulator [Shinella oryzae]UPA26825.1 GntR family transcriptional regulator [Shinella oryzae]WLS05308.1 GntR family transcriptional regulator [Shinella oryzae]
MELGNIGRKSLATHVYEVVRNAIVVGELTPGSLHSVNDISERLNVSRTPVREALLKLEEQGMVSFERNRGARILETTVHDLEELFSLRFILEIPAAHRAARRPEAAAIKKLQTHLNELTEAYRLERSNARAHLEPDARFHKQIAAMAGSRRLGAILDNLFDQQMIADGTSGGFTRGMEEIIDDHVRIFDAIAQKDPDAAANAMRDHLLISSRALVSKEAGDAEVGKQFEPLFIDILTMTTSGILK